MGRKWTLDSAIESAEDVIITIKSLYETVVVSSSGSNTTTITLSNGGTASSKAEENIVRNVEVIETTYKYTGGSAGVSNEYLLQDSNGNDIAKIYFDTGQIEFFVITAPPIDGEDNIEVEFTPKDTSYYNEDYIDNCEFGIQFGVEGYKDRLFLSGNKEHQNIVFYSEFDDFTYFPFVNMQSLGNDNNPVVGFSRLNDSTIAIHKKNDSIDPSIYYMTYSINENYEEQGIEKYSFPVITGVLGESPVSHNTCLSLSGDNLFLSENGVYGIELNENIKSNERYALERSGFINTLLNNHADLSLAKAIVYKNRYYLAIDDVVYVADARFKSSARTGDMRDTFNYEWWYWTNISVKQWLIIDNELYFLSNNSKLNKFYNGYIDVEKMYFNSGVLTSVEDNNYLLQFSEEYADLVREENEIIINSVNYQMCDIDKYRIQFKIKDANGNYVDTASLNLNSSFYILDKQNVKSIWKTPILSLGTTIYSKNLLSSTLVCEPNIEGSLEYGYRTSNKVSKMNTALTPERGLDFNDFDLTRLSFIDILARSRTIKTRVRNFCFIEFIIRSEDGNDCALNNFTITYNIGRKNKGVR